MHCSKQYLKTQGVWQISRDKEPLASREDINLRYKRARSMCKESGLTLEDIRDLTPKFWEFHFDLISTRDMSAFIIATIHLNLCVGTLSHFATSRPDLSRLLTDLLSFDICGEFMLTEVDHGLDARNLETTATLLPNGGFNLHTPRVAAAKAMPPTTPLAGIPRVAIVFARLMIGQDDCGIKPFIVYLSDSKNLRKGITSRALPTRPGTKPLDHAITSFNHVYLPPEALLGPLSKPRNSRADFLWQIRRVAIGTLSLTIMGISSIKVATKIAAAYSQRRLTTTSEGTSISILSFSTQQRPMLQGFVDSIVLETFAHWTIKQIMEKEHAQIVRHALATVFKAAVTQASEILHEFSQRCGWQGLFAYNQISELALTFQGNSIAEGDILVLCIRLASELLGGKYDLPATQDPNSRLAQHERGLFLEAKRKIDALGGYNNHRKEAFNHYCLPLCRTLIEAVSHRMAYEAAKDAEVHIAVLDLFEWLCMSKDLSWYVENGLITRAKFFDSITEAYNRAYPVLLEALNSTEIDDYITAPILTEKSWEDFVEKLPTFSNGSIRFDAYLGKL